MSRTSRNTSASSSASSRCMMNPFLRRHLFAISAIGGSRYHEDWASCVVDDGERSGSPVDTDDDLCFDHARSFEARAFAQVSADPAQGVVVLVRERFSELVHP